ncbi:unnamed protein product [Brachionus calyciflorus]|uniref:RING-type domain-containing protein n=1 Tax=Brachionus calyciflorus TaxID=104777 RepID=A0A813XS05_9BILA|nr:unnamed protein product [Brachionus calyciflorus]
MMSENLNNLIRCEICKNILKDPILLPCDETCCARCAFKFKNQDRNSIQCYFCQQEHEIPKSGFHSNKQAEKLIDSILQARFKEIVESVKQKVKENEEIKEGVEKIKNHCSLLRYDVELKTKFALDDVNQIHDLLIDKINEYEKKALWEYENNLDYKSDIDRLDFSVEDFLEKFNLNLNIKSLREI